jgi:hypothetical protein
MVVPLTVVRAERRRNGSNLAHGVAARRTATAHAARWRPRGTYARLQLRPARVKSEPSLTHHNGMDHTRASSAVGRGLMQSRVDGSGCPGSVEDVWTGRASTRGRAGGARACRPVSRCIASERTRRLGARRRCVRLPHARGADRRDLSCTGAHCDAHGTGAIDCGGTPDTARGAVGGSLEPAGVVAAAAARGRRRWSPLDGSWEGPHIPINC